MEMEIKVGDKFILHSTDGNDYDIKVINVNLCREPDMKYALDVRFNGEPISNDVFFKGDDFFELPQVEKVEG